MIIKKNITLYICEHCKKKMFVKRAMENHEFWCGSNPKNYKKCNQCKFLQETTNTYWIDSKNEETIEVTAKSFRCTKLDKIMYPLIIEKKKSYLKYPETFKGQEPMPNECEYFKCEYDDALDLLLGF